MSLRWNGLWRKGAGTVMAYAPDHPWPRKGTTRVPEHVLVIEREIGRRLRKGENVHHINENRQDNRLENLELLTVAAHAREHARRRRAKAQAAPESPLREDK